MFSRVYWLCTTFTFLKLLGWTVIHRTIVLLAHATTLQCLKVPFTYLYTPALVSHMYTCMQFLPIPPCHLQTLSLSLYTLRPKWLAMTFFILSTGRVVFSGGFSWVKSLILQTYKSSCLTHRHASIYFFEIHSLQWAHTYTHVPFFLFGSCYHIYRLTHPHILLPNKPCMLMMFRSQFCIVSILTSAFTLLMLYML